MKPGLWGLAVLALVACAPPPEAPKNAAVRAAAAILDGAQRTMGVWPTPDRLDLLTDAAVEGPTGAFRTVVQSASDGRARMEQPHNGFLAGVGRSGAWRIHPDSGPAALSGDAAAFLRSHELHMLSLLPRSRLDDARFLGTVRLDSVPALAVAFSGDSVVAFFNPSDTLPVGLAFRWIEPEVRVRWWGWTESRGVSLFREASFTQGTEEWHYRYERVEVGRLDDAVFEADGPRAAGTPDA